MARCLFVFILILCSQSSIYAQKNHRAAKAMNELKFDKSIELFEDILKKDSNDIISLIGFSISHLYTYTVQKKIISHEILTDCYRNLKKSKLYYINLDQKSKFFLQNELHVYNEMSIDSFMVTNSIIIWNEYIKENKSITENEIYFSNFYIPNLKVLPKTVEIAIDNLYYDSLSKRNKLEDYIFYLNKFPNGYFLNIAKEKIIDIEYEQSILSEGIESLLNFNNKYLNNKYKLKVNTEIESREYKLAYDNIGVDKLEQFIEKYPKSDLIANAKIVVEERDYILTKQNNELSYYDSFLSKHSNSLLHKNEFEDSISNKLFIQANTTVDKEKLIQFIKRIISFHESESNKFLIDSIKMKIYLIDYNDALLTNNLDVLRNFSNNYKKDNYLNFLIIRKKLFTIWEQSLLNNFSRFDDNELSDFIKDYAAESDYVFTNILEKTKIYLTNYIDSLKPSLISSILVNNNFYSSLNDKLYSLSKIISSKIYFKNQTTNSEIINKIKNLNLNFVNRTDLLSIFFPNLSISNVYIESIFENNNSILSISNQTKTSGFSSKIYIWDTRSSTYLENIDLNTNNSICKAITQRYGVASFTMPHFTGLINNQNQLEVMFYGYKTSDLICCPSFVITMLYEFRDNHLVPITASGVNLTSGNAEFTPKKFNYLNIGISLNLNSITNFINK